MGRTRGSRGGRGAPVMDAPWPAPEELRFKLWDAPGEEAEITVEHPRTGRRSYLPESGPRALGSGFEGLEISFDEGAWQPCVRGDGCWSYVWREHPLGRTQAAVRLRPRRAEEPRRACLFLVDLP